MNRAPLDPLAIRQLLKRAGLDDREVVVYLALLTLKSGPVSAIAKGANVQRSNAYQILRELASKSLVSELQRGAVLHFVCEPPERLLSYIEDRKRELGTVGKLVEGALPLLASMTKPLQGEPRVTKLKGIAGMKQVYRDLLHEEFIGLFNVESMYATFGMTVADVLFGKDSINLRGRDLLVDNAGAKRYLREWAPTETYAIRMLPKNVTFPTDTLVYGDTVALFSFDDDKTIVCIENKNIADTLRAWFEILWAASRKP